MFVDFGFAERYYGDCYLRFDDTNPEAEKQEYIDHIQDIVAWLGYKPWKVRTVLSAHATMQSSWMKAALLLRNALTLCDCGAAGDIQLRLLHGAVQFCHPAHQIRERVRRPPDSRGDQGLPVSRVSPRAAIFLFVHAVMCKKFTRITALP